MAKDPRDVPRVIVAPVVRPFERQADPRASFVEPQFAIVTIGNCEQRFDVEMAHTEWIRHRLLFAGPLELPRQ